MAEARINFSDQENRLPALRSKRGEPLKLIASNALANPPSRTILGVLRAAQTTTTNIRKQPSRTVKQGVSSDTVLKPSQDENTYAKPQKSFSSTSGPSFTIYSDDSADNSQNSADCSASSTAVSECAISSSNSARVTDKNTLKYAASKLTAPAGIPPCITALQRHEPVVSSSSGGDSLMDDSAVATTEDDRMSVSTPVRPQEELLKLREEQMWDMSEYATDIYEYLREAEKVHKPRLNYMQKQADISVSMRWILLDWMVEVSEEYNLSTETLYLAVSYIDRFLSHMSVKRDKLQLVGTTAMFIAAKYEEIFPPEVSQFAYITDNTYKVAHILRMEHLILKVLSFDMAVPTVYTFLNMFARTLGCSEGTSSLALYIAELTILDCDPFLRFLPSEIAASALAISNFTQGYTAWPAMMTTKYGYSLQELRECYVNLNRAYNKVHDHDQHAIREKYKSAKFHRVSIIKCRSDFPF